MMARLSTARLLVFRRFSVSMIHQNQDRYKYYLKLGNLPFESSKEEITSFTEGHAKPEDCYVDYGRYGRPSGSAYLGFNDKSAHDSVLSMHEKTEIGGRVVRINQATKLSQSVRYQLENPVDANSNCVKLLGLPFKVTEDEIVSFLDGCSVVEVKISKNNKKRPIGEAVVKFADEKSKEKSFSYSRKEIGNRFES